MSSAGIPCVLPGRGQWFILNTAQSILEEDTGRELVSVLTAEGFPPSPAQPQRLQEGARSPPLLRKAEGTRPDRGLVLLVLRAKLPPASTSLLSRHEARQPILWGACLSSQDASGLPSGAPQAPRSSPSSGSHTAEAGVCPGAPGGPVPQPSTSPQCCSRVSPGGTPSPWPLPKGKPGVQGGASLSRLPPCRALFRDSSALTHRPRGAGDESGEDRPAPSSQVLMGVICFPCCLPH